MAHFAQLDANNTVINVIVVNNDELIDPNTSLESEEMGISFCKSLYGSDTVWKQTSYNHNFRRQFAGIGHIYYEKLDAFISPQLYPSWIFNEDTGIWNPPVPKPTDDKNYIWNEETKSWDENVIPVIP
jgi:hypothetical protein